MLASSVSITIRYKDRKTITRSKKLSNPVSLKEELFHESKLLFLNNWNGDPIRLLGVTGADLIEKRNAVKQLDIFSFEKEAKKEPLIDALNHLRLKYGENIINPAGENKRVRDDKQNQSSETSFSKDFLDFFPKE